MKIGFEMRGKTIPISSILPVKEIPESIKGGRKYATIRSSIEEVGIIEPPMVHPAKKRKNAAQKYLLLDGHVRIDILKELGHEQVFVLISTDDEGYTYNHKVNRLSPIQEHFMILKAIKNGLDEARIAKALNVDVARIRQKRNLLNGVCPEAVELLKDKQVAPKALRCLSRVKPARQVEMANLMKSFNNYTQSYAQALIASTPEDQFVNNCKNREKLGVSPEDMVRMEKEIEPLFLINWKIL